MRFSILGNVYLGPGWFVTLSPKAYAALMAAGGAWIALAAFLAWRWTAPRARAAARRRDDRTVARTLATGAAGFYLAVGAYVTLAYPPTTDEPHYLMLTDSLIAGTGLDVGPAYRAGAQTKFYPSATIDPHVVIADDGRWYSQHTVGLPLLVLPGYALAGRWGSLIILALLAGALIGALFLAARAAGAAAGNAVTACLLAAATAPLLFGSTLIFTEVPAALFIAVALATLNTRATPAVAAALLPWLHPRYALIAAGLGVVHWLKRGPRVLGAWLGALAVSGGLFFAVYHGDPLTAVLNVLTETYPARMADLNAAHLTAVSFANPLTGFLAKWLDRDFGVLPYAPWLLAILPGLIARRVRPAWRPFLIAGAPYVLMTCLFRNWGGSAFPGRTLIPLLPFALPWLAEGLEHARQDRFHRVAFGFLIVWSLGMGWALTACPVLRYTSGRDWMAAHAGVAWKVTPCAWFPSFTTWP